jgi:RsmE family RNA methyltransferase
MFKTIQTCYTSFVNIILFEAHETEKPLPARDARTIHLLKVLHKKQGDTFEAGVLNGKLGIGHIDQVALDGSIGFTLELHEHPLPRIPIRVAVGFPRPIQLRRLLRDLANLGIEAVDLISTALGEKSYRDTKFLEGGDRTAFIEGAIQARDTCIPQLSRYASLKQWLSQSPWKQWTQSVQAFPLLLAADNVRAQGSMAQLSPIPGPVVLAIGSERGWADQERDLLEKAGFLRLSLGSRALRTETACVAAAILAMEKMGKLE